MTQQLIRMPQPVGKGGQHFQGDIRTAPHKRNKMLAREHCQAGVLGHHGVG